jgi:hypothetical protein
VIYKNLNYNLLTDLVPIARMPQNAMLVVTSEQLPVKTLKELVEYLKANPDKIPGGTAGMARARISARSPSSPPPARSYQLVPYRGTGPAMQDLVANQIQVMVDQSSNSLPQVRAGKIRAYAVTAKARSPRHRRFRPRPRPAIRWRSRSGTACGRPRARRRDHRQAQRRRDRHLQDPDIRRRWRISARTSRRRPRWRRPPSPPSRRRVRALGEDPRGREGQDRVSLAGARRIGAPPTYEKSGRHRQGGSSFSSTVRHCEQPGFAPAPAGELQADRQAFL